MLSQLKQTVFINISAVYCMLWMDDDVGGKGDPEMRDGKMKRPRGRMRVVDGRMAAMMEPTVTEACHTYLAFQSTLYLENN